MSFIDSMPALYPPPPQASAPHSIMSKNSLTHPLNISWMVPDEYVPFLSETRLPESVDLFDLLTNPDAYNVHFEAAERPSVFLGNLALSSCPGKKVRLTGPVRGRASINRDLDLDFQRLRSFGITTVVCCLDDSELSFLGAPWPKYYELATKNSIDIIRLPMIEGSCPDNLEGIDAVVDEVSERMKTGQNVLAHCRGGVGRAGLFACCWLLKSLYCLSPERAIRFVRVRRSPKAIETMRQAEFIVQYAEYVGYTLEKQSMAKVRTHIMHERERERAAMIQAAVSKRERWTGGQPTSSVPVPVPVPAPGQRQTESIDRIGGILKSISL